MRLIFLLNLISLSCISQVNGIYVSDAGNFNKPPWHILRFYEDGSESQIFIDEFLNWPQDILFLHDEREVLISSLGSGCINVYDIETGRCLREFACGIGGPTRISIGPEGLLYVLQWNGPGKVLRYDLSGELIDEFTSLAIPQAIGMAWDEDENLFVSSYSEDKVYRFDSHGIFIEVFIDSNLVGPTNIWFDYNGDLLVSDYGGTAVKRFNPAGEYVSDFLSGLSKSEGYLQLENGDYLIGNGATSSIRRFRHDGTPLGDFSQEGNIPLLNPNAIAIREEFLHNLGYNQTTGQLFVAYQMPDLGELNILGPLSHQVERLTLHDENGETLWEREFCRTISIEDLAPGMYYLTCKLESGNTSTYKFFRTVQSNHQR